MPEAAADNAAVAADDDKRICDAAKSSEVVDGATEPVVMAELADYRADESIESDVVKASTLGIDLELATSAVARAEVVKNAPDVDEAATAGLDTTVTTTVGAKAYVEA